MILGLNLILLFFNSTICILKNFLVSYEIFFHLFCGIHDWLLKHFYDGSFKIFVRYFISPSGYWHQLTAHPTCDFPSSLHEWFSIVPWTLSCVRRFLVFLKSSILHMSLCWVLVRRSWHMHCGANGSLKCRIVGMLFRFIWCIWFPWGSHWSCPCCLRGERGLLGPSAGCLLWEDGVEGIPLLSLSSCFFHTACVLLDRYRVTLECMDKDISQATPLVVVGFLLSCSFCPPWYLFEEKESPQAWWRRSVALQLLIFGGGPTRSPLLVVVGSSPCLRDSDWSEGGISPPGIAIVSLEVVKQNTCSCCFWLVWVVRCPAIVLFLQSWGPRQLAFFPDHFSGFSFGCLLRCTKAYSWPSRGTRRNGSISYCLDLSSVGSKLRGWVYYNSEKISIVAHSAVYDRGFKPRPL